ncbi:cation antiporter [Candidatus Halobonum tyrrellensis G22]|uniref:Cation antiporter n=2 Tax=Candidatus Halobonum TaxID=1431544 RepID=V4J1W3_9EURY|nr:cation antiporter [Candidatus Halobonum tyrrellensis G22]
MRRWVVNALTFTVLWLFVRGVPLLPPETGLVRIAEEGLIGLAVSVPVAYGLRNFYRGPPTARTLRVAPYAVLYAFAFLKELLVANLDVARIVIAPSLPIDPAVVEVPLRVRSDVAVTTIANSITLTPGTLTMDYDDDANSLYVHSINGEDILDTIRTWEDYALVIFNEELKPGDPVPDRVEANGDGEGGGTDE